MRSSVRLSSKCGRVCSTCGNFPATLTGIASAAPFLGGEYSTEEIEAEHIRQVLARKTSIQDAAEVLKMDRSTLLRKRKSLGVIKTYLEGRPPARP